VEQCEALAEHLGELCLESEAEDRVRAAAAAAAPGATTTDRFVLARHTCGRPSGAGGGSSATGRSQVVSLVSWFQ
jgi:hypothetical protein